MFWIGEETYGITHEQLKAAGRELCIEFSYSSAEERLDNIVELDGRPLAEPRDVARRSVGCCRDYALMLASILRHKGIPARVRTGVSLYFVAPEGRLIEDHYITEHWDAERVRWELTDPQIDDVQRPAIEKGLDTIDLPVDRFLTGWQLYEELRAGRIPEFVGFPPRNAGFTYGRNKLFADFVGVTGHEMPVHGWWGIGDSLNDMQAGDEALIDRMIEILRRIDGNDPAALSEALELTSTHPRLAMPEGYVVPIAPLLGACREGRCASMFRGRSLHRVRRWLCSPEASAWNSFFTRVAPRAPPPKPVIPLATTTATWSPFRPTVTLNFARRTSGPNIAPHAALPRPYTPCSLSPLSNR